MDWARSMLVDVIDADDDDDDDDDEDEVVSCF